MDEIPTDYFAVSIHTSVIVYPNTLPNTPQLLPNPVLQATSTEDSCCQLHSEAYTYSTCRHMHLHMQTHTEASVHYGIACSWNPTTTCYNRTVKTADGKKKKKLGTMALGNTDCHIGSQTQTYI